MFRETDTIMLVDDTPSNLSVLFDCLEGAGYRVLVVTSGEAALEGVAHLMPDIILLDVMMPGMDGFETCRRFKADNATRDIPIIFLTALDELVDEVKGFDLGAVDYITKPIHVEKVLARLKNHLTLLKLRKTLEEKNKELNDALDNIRLITGLLPICSICKKIRDDTGYWNRVEDYISKHTDAEFTHSICPVCLKQHYAEFTDAEDA